MSYWVYKCNGTNQEHQRDWGDWSVVFSQEEPYPWGRVSVHPKLAQLRPGDTILAYQTRGTKQNTLVGTAEVVKFLRGRVYLRPIERIGVRVRPLKVQSSRIAAIPAFRSGPIQTIYDIKSTDADALLAAARAARDGGSSALAKRNLSRRVLFVRVGWMRRYAGIAPDDPRPLGGGAYNRTKRGSELFNFDRPPDGTVYGYFQPPGEGVNLRRIDPAEEGKSLPEVLVIFFARNPRLGGSYVVGWYQNATVYKDFQQLRGQLAKRRGGCGYFCSTALADAVLLSPTERQNFPIPKRAQGTPGQRNVFYTFDSDGNRKTLKWLDGMLSRIDSHDVGATPGEDDNNAPSAPGQGRLPAPERRAVEEAAMRRAIAHFEGKGYRVERRGKPYDLLCTAGKAVLYVEVKGTTGSPEVVILTRGEVSHAQAHAGQLALYILHGITLKADRRGSPKAQGGHAKIFHPWQLSDDDLLPLQFQYRVPVSR